MGRWAIGAVAIDDRAPGGVGGGAPDRAAIGVVRATREFGRQSSVGALASTREVNGGFNRVISADTLIRLGQNWTASAQAVRSETKTAAESLSGSSIHASLGYRSRSFWFDTEYLDRSENFRADLGFITRTDIRSIENGARYTWFPKKGGILSFGPSLWSDVLWNRSGELQDWSLSPEFEIELPAGTEIEVGISQSFERYAGREFRKHGESIEMSTEWLKWLGASFSYEQGTGINYVPAAGSSPSLASEREVQLAFTLRPTSRLRVEETYIYNGLRNPRGAGIVESEKASLFDLHLLRTKVNYQFSRELSLRAIVDYNDLRPNTRYVALERDKTLSVDLLGTCMINPWTAIYMGYTNHRANLVLEGAAPAVLRRTDALDMSTGRQLFVKVGYLLRY